MRLDVGSGSYDLSDFSTTLKDGGLFDFFKPHFKPVILDPVTGAVVSG